MKNKKLVITFTGSFGFINIMIKNIRNKLKFTPFVLITVLKHSRVTRATFLKIYDNFLATHWQIISAK